jgi:hypothetical protein
MTHIKLHAGQNGWFYEVWIASRPVVVGWCATRERALQQAELV